MFDTALLQNLLNAVQTKTGKAPSRINTLDPKIANNVQLKSLVKEVEKTSRAFFVNLEEAQYTFTSSVDKNGNVRVYSPSVGNLGGVAVLSWGALTVPIETIARDADLSITKEGNQFALRASTVDGKKAIEGKIRLVLPKGSKISLAELQDCLGDDETPCQLQNVLGNVIVDTIPTLALERYKGQTLNVSSWVATGDGDFGKRGFLTFFELGDARIQCPTKVRDSLPKVNYATPDLLTFERGEFLLKIDGSGTVAATGNKYLVCTPILTKGIDLSGFGEDEDEVYGLPTIKSAEAPEVELDSDELASWGEAEPLTEFQLAELPH